MFVSDLWVIYVCGKTNDYYVLTCSVCYRDERIWNILSLLLVVSIYLLFILVSVHYCLLYFSLCYPTTRSLTHGEIMKSTSSTTSSPLLNQHRLFVSLSDTQHSWNLLPGCPYPTSVVRLCPTLRPEVLGLIRTT